MSVILLNLQSNQLIKLDSETPFIIGRGNVQGCFDKRVSRNHGRVTCTVDGKVRLEALHFNPCFFTRNGAPPIQQLKKNEQETLNQGDYLGLLPNAFWFKVTMDKDKDKTEPAEDKNASDEVFDENNRTDTFEETTKDPSSPQQKTESVKSAECPCSNVQNKDSMVLPSTSKSEISSSSDTHPAYGTPEFEKTRRLPLWMYEIDEPIQPKKSSNKHPVTSDRVENSNKKPKISEVDIKKEPPDDEVMMLNVPSTSKAGGDSTPPSSDPQREQQNTPQVLGDTSVDKKKKDGYESDVDIRVAEREICQFEGNCYRKNPKHKLDFSHPGDADYVPYEERPLCYFGASCYRRNTSHRVNFRHPTSGSTSRNNQSPSSSRGSLALSPLPAKRKRKKVKRDSDYGDDDEYDLEDPFINDASSDEYVPSDLNSEEDLDASREEED